MRRYAHRVLVVLVPLTLAACTSPTAPIQGRARSVAPGASAAHDVIVPDPTCVSGYNVTQGRCA